MSPVKRIGETTNMFINDSPSIPFEVFWASYLLHHKHPVTRLLHLIGTAIVLAAFVASVVRMTPVPAMVGLLVGYACAFIGHWYVEKNQPLTLKHPILAGLCNMRLFGLECLGVFKLGGGYEGAVKRAFLVVPLVVAQGCAHDVGNC